jgi:hypothetical protein
MWFYKNYTTICSVLIYFSFLTTHPNDSIILIKNHKKINQAIEKGRVITTLPEQTTN